MREVGNPCQRISCLGSEVDEGSTVRVVTVVDTQEDLARVTGPGKLDGLALNDVGGCIDSETLTNDTDNESSENNEELHFWEMR